MSELAHPNPHGDETDRSELRQDIRDATPEDRQRGTSGAGQSSHDQRDAPRRDVIDLGQGTAGEDRHKGEEGAAGDKEAGHGNEERGRQEKNPPAPPPKWVLFAAVAVVLALVAWGGYEHWRSYSASKQTTSDTVERPVDVLTTEAKRLDAPIDLTLPGETQAFDTANIYPRATGYIAERRVDIGSRVKQGDLLIKISSPDLDQQLAQAQAQIGQTQAALVQAQAQVDQAEANLNLAKVNFARSNQLTQQGYETQQNRDQQQANLQTQQANLESAKAGVRVGEANIAAQQATIDRLKALTAFEEVRAPFDGVITSRNVDLGELVNADVSTGQPMFTVVRDTVIRVMIRVPQNAALGIHQGLEAAVIVPQMPERHFAGRVQRSSVALLYSSRTLTTEVDVQNDTGDLRPGLYVTVSFAIPRETPQVSVPADALIFDQHGMRVATVDDGLINFHPVNIVRDHGTTVDIREGLKGGERLVLNMPATLKQGAKVKEMREEDQKKQDEQDEKKNASGNRQAKADEGGQSRQK